MATTYLATQNPHPRDKYLHFDEGPHKYTIQGIDGVTPETEFTSVTTWIHQHFEHFDAKKVIASMMRNQKKWNDPIANAKYYGKTPEEIEEMWASAGQDAATKGTAMHYKIECFYNTPTDTTDATDAEFKYFMNFHNEHVAPPTATLRPYRTEWTVFHEEARIAGSIDMVYEIIDTTDLAIYDWKRCREITKTNRANKFATHPAIEHLPDTNYWHYALQLNLYKYILQTKYDKKITDLYIIVLHPEGQNYQRIKLPDLQSEVADLITERITKINT
jgi:ATP-dependent exoDNAse (exonuclease V) beta subunit